MQYLMTFKILFMKTIISKAYTNSEWDSVDFAVIEINDTLLQFIKELSTQVKDICKQHGIYGHFAVSSDNADFFIGERGEAHLGEHDDFAVIPGTLDTSNESRPENDLKGGDMRIFSDTVQFVTWGKHTSEEFWTPEIQINKL